MMARPQWRASTNAHWSVRPITLAAKRLDAARLLVKLHFRARLHGQHSVAEWCLLDTGAPLSVVPFSMHHRCVCAPRNANERFLRTVGDRSGIYAWRAGCAPL